VTATAPRGLLAIFAHPDDETFGAGGTMGLAAAAGVPTWIVCATDGDQGGEEGARALDPQLRRGELRCAMTALGVGEPIFLGYGDSGMEGWAKPAGCLALADEEEVVERLVAVIRDLRPATVVTFDPGGIYGHPDHVTISARATEAFRRAAGEAGGPTTQVAEYRNLVQRQNVDAVIGYISSGDCLAVAPVAEELKKLTLLFDCGTPRIFEDGSYRYVFRTAPHATLDNVAAALYVTETFPKVKKVAGINQNYAWGQDSWNDFEASMKMLKPSIQVTTSQMPKLGAGQYGAEISAIMSGSPEIIHSSLWGGDLDAFVLQAAPRGLFKKSVAVLTAGETAMYKLAGQIPDGTMVGARGANGVFAPENALNAWFRTAYTDRYSLPPVYPSYRMAQAILALKSAYEKAQAGGAAPDQDKIIADLDEVLRAFTSKVEALQRELVELKQKLEDDQPELGPADDAPPHY